MEIFRFRKSLPRFQRFRVSRGIGKLRKVGVAGRIDKSKSTYISERFGPHVYYEHHDFQR